MKHKITILSNENSNDFEEIWRDEYVIFAKIKELNPYNLKFFENIGFGHQISANYFIFTVRFILGLKVNMRIKLGDKLYNIQKITNVAQENRFLQILGVLLCQ